MNESSELKQGSLCGPSCNPTSQSTEGLWSVLENKADSFTKATWHHFYFQDNDQVVRGTLPARTGGLARAGLGLGEA